MTNDEQKLDRQLGILRGMLIEDFESHARIMANTGYGADLIQPAEFVKSLHTSLGQASAHGFHFLDDPHARLDAILAQYPQASFYQSRAVIVDALIAGCLAH